MSGSEFAWMGVRRRSFGSSYVIQRRYELRRLQAFSHLIFDNDKSLFFMVNAREVMNNEEALRVEVLFYYENLIYIITEHINIF